MFGTCKVCLEKQSRISDLQMQISDLKRLVFPRQSLEVTPQGQEMDNLLSGNQDDILMINDQIELEAAALLSGNYDNSQVEI